MRVISQSEISARDKFQPHHLDDHERRLIAGAVNRYGVDNPLFANENNLSVFTWEQILAALMASRRDCIGDSLDDIDDVIYAVRAERKYYAH